MDFVMLGHHGVGKTSYLSLMYAAMRDGIHGFGLDARAAADHEALTRAAEYVLAGHPPPRTENLPVLELVLRFHGRAAVTLRWHEHHDLVTGPGAKPSGQVLTADGIVLFAEAPQLLEDGAYRAEMRRTAHRLRQALAERGRQLTPLVLTFTKCDLVCRPMPPGAVPTALLADLTAPFSDLVDAVAATEHLRGAVALVSCGPEPVNITVPVLWSLHHAIAGRGLALQTLCSPSRRLTPLTGPAAEYARLAPLFEPADRLAVLLTRVPSF
ncbi:hypothetical protein [Streptomyces sp. NBC_00582]|uniref:hypothetical protein n=1 Tax=Streptomyces sp. NBC_00582 TaxID=2975783 RepID=UPI002E810D40|nr:hypothetical protein [Streptomyces sp. NBC_00582]WUB59714.1 hypothetical protein OG852_04550 [Streptomyces sp. NBC_00582]